MTFLRYTIRGCDFVSILISQYFSSGFVYQGRWRNQTFNLITSKRYIENVAGYRTANCEIFFFLQKKKN